MIISSNIHCILELFILTNVIVLTETQDFLTATERRILEGLTGKRGGQIHRFEQGGSTKLTNVRAPISHVVIVGELGNQSQHPVPLVHRTNHVSDLFGEMGNQAPVTVVTRQSAAYIDLQGKHGNKSFHPVLHKQSGPNKGLEGQNGNILPHPIFHRQSGPQKDLAGQHGKKLPNPVVHRQSGPHKDLAGQHGKELSHSVVHRQSGPNKDVAGQHGQEVPHPVVLKHSGSNIILPGQHGNESPHPIVQRQSGSHFDFPIQEENEFPRPAVHRQSNSYTNLPGQLGNKSSFPSVHRDDYQMQSSGQRGPLSLNPGTHSQHRFIDPVSGTPVIIPGQTNNIDSFRHGHSQSVTGVNRLTLDSAIGRRHLFPPWAIPQPPARIPFGFRIPRGTDTQFPRRRNPVVSFRGPFGPPPFLLSPETRRMPGQMRRRMIMGGLPPPFIPLQPPPPRPARIGLGGILAGVFGNLFGSLFRL